jgi:hypothetical protein
MIYKKTVNGKSKPVLFADDTSIIFSNSNLGGFKNDVKIQFDSLNKWFKASRCSLNFDETHLCSLQQRIVLNFMWTLVMLTN